MKHPVIAIDGPAASGKSTVAKILASRIPGFVYVDTGAMYRAVTWLALAAKVDLQDSATLASMAGTMELECQVEQGATVLYYGGAPVPPAELRSPAVAAGVSFVARVPEVRTRLVAIQRELRAISGLTMEGRDIGSVVFPDTPYKFFLSANEEVRAQRRADQGETDSIAKRDRMDSTRAVAPLQAAPDAICIDSSSMGIEQVVEAVLAACKERGLSVSGV